MRRIYLDHAATTPLDPRVLEAMMPLMTAEFGNPSAVNAEGRKAKRQIDRARQQVADAIGAQSHEICFTSGGSESDNLAIQGVMRRHRHRGRHMITTAVEHHAVLHTCVYLEQEGFEVTVLPVDETGKIRLSDLKKAIRPDTALISVMTANNEVGTFQPIAEIGQLARERGIIFHTDAVQAFGNMPLNVTALNVDMMSLSAHKVYGPKGVGALYIRDGIGLDSLIHGGQQEYARRAGTENTAGIVGFGRAAELITESLEERISRLSALQQQLIEGIEKIEGAHLMGDPVERLPGNVHFCFEGVKNEALLMALDMAGIAASGGSACTSGIIEPSHVLGAMGVSPALAQGALRLTLGQSTTAEDIEFVINNLTTIINRLKK